jgi:DNA ligase-1
MEKTVVEILEDIESIQGTNAKVAHLEIYKENETLREFFRLAEDPYTDFGVKKLPKLRCRSNSIVNQSDVQKYIELLRDELAPRGLTGNSARGAVILALESMDEITQKWCVRLLLRNLRCGVSGKLVNRIWPGLVEPFAVLLATQVPVDSKNIPIGIKFPVRVEPKLDGLRCIAIKHNGVVTLYTRSGSVLQTLPKIKKVLEDCPMDEFVLDGEAMINRADLESWNDSASVIMSHKNKKDDVDMTLNVFDSMSFETWKSRKSWTLDVRLQFRDIVLKKSNSTSVVPVFGKLVNSLEELVEYFNECLEHGYEGIMIKDPNGLYEWKRVKTSVMKYKPVETHEGIVVGWYKGGVGTKHEDTFGGFEILGSNGAITRVGGGFRDEQRDEIGKDPDSYVGRIAEVEGAKGLTIDGKIRFPVFLRWRAREDVDQSLFETYESFMEKNR